MAAGARDAPDLRFSFGASSTAAASTSSSPAGSSSAAAISASESSAGAALSAASSGLSIMPMWRFAARTDAIFLRPGAMIVRSPVAFFVCPSFTLRSLYSMVQPLHDCFASTPPFFSAANTSSTSCSSACAAAARRV